MDDGKQGYDPSPVNPLPPTVVILFLLIFGVEAILAGAEAGLYGGSQAVGWRINLIRDYGFTPEIFQWMMTTGQWPSEHLIRLVTYPFVHGGFTQMLMGAVFVLAMGKMVGEVIGNIAVPVIFLGSSIIGAAAYGLVPEKSWLLGAFPGAYGLIGGYTFILWARAKMTGGSQTQAFTLIALLMGVQLLFGLLFGTDNTWVADIAGFAAGFALCFLLVPGARRALLRRMRGN